jgi:hypothetical protein
MPVEVIVDRILQLGHAREGAAPDALHRDLCEEAFDEIEPGRTRRREVQLEARMLGQPRLHLRCLVRPVVVEHQVDVEVLLHAPVDPLQEADELLGAVTRLALASADGVSLFGCGTLAASPSRHRRGVPASPEPG